MKNGKTQLNLFAAQIYTQHLMIDAGIIPYSKYLNIYYDLHIPSTENDIDDLMKQLSPEEQRVVKRKFRKLWRKIYRRSTKRLKKTLGLSTKMLKTEERKVFVKNKNPTYAQRELRKLLVSLELLVQSLEKFSKK